MKNFFVHDNYANDPKDNSLNNFVDQHESLSAPAFPNDRKPSGKPAWKEAALRLNCPEVIRSSSSLPTFLMSLCMEYGTLSPSDLSRLLGLSLPSVSVAICRNRDHFLRRNLPRKSFDAWRCVALNFRSKKVREMARHFSNPVLPDKGALKTRHLSHEYALSLSCLLLSLGTSRETGGTVEFHREASIGNFRDAASKHGAEITVDCLCKMQIYLDGKFTKIIFLEQDMGTENFRILARKLYDYAQTDFFSAKAAEAVTILISYGPLSCADPHRPACPADHPLGLVLLLRAFHQTVLQGRPDLCEERILSARLDAYLDGISKRGIVRECADSLASSVADAFTLGKDGMRRLFFDLCMSRHARKDARRLLFASVPLLTGNSRKATLDELLLCAVRLAQMGKDAVTSLLYEASASRRAYLRRLGFSLTLCRISERMDSFVDHGGVGLNRDNSWQFLAPLAAGQQVFLTPTAQIDGCVPFLCPSESALPFRMIRDAILSSCGAGKSTAVSFRPLSGEIPLDSASTLPSLRLRNEFRVSSVGGEDLTFCAENLSLDSGAAFRARLFCAHGSETPPVQLVLIVSNEVEAFDFLANYFGISCPMASCKSRLRFPKRKSICNISPFVAEPFFENGKSKVIKLRKCKSHVLFFVNGNYVDDNSKLLSLTNYENLFPASFDV